MAFRKGSKVALAAEVFGGGSVVLPAKVVEKVGDAYIVHVYHSAEAEAADHWTCDNKPHTVGEGVGQIRARE